MNPNYDPIDMSQTRFFNPSETIGPATLLRRLAAAAYDGLLVLAVLMVTTGIYMAISAFMLGTERYQAISESGENIGDPILTLFLFMTLYCFFGYFWTRTGQTLGMQVWHIRIQNTNSTSISWIQVLMRMIGATLSIFSLGFGYLWTLLDHKKRSWQCLLSNTEVVQITKKK